MGAAFRAVFEEAIVLNGEGRRERNKRKRKREGGDFLPDDGVDSEGWI